MSRLRTLGITAILTLVVWIVIVWLMPKEPSPYGGFRDAAAALAFITAAAVAIERVIEAIWTVLGGTLGAYWPLNAVRAQVDRLVGSLDQALKPLHEQVQQLLQAGTRTAQGAVKDLAAFKAEIADLETRLKELKGMAPDNQRVQLLAAAATQRVNVLEKEFPQVEKAAALVRTTIDGLQDFASSFKDNPGRRLISLYVGILLGLAVAGTFSLDVIEAAMDAPVQTASQQAAGQVRGAGTGADGGQTGGSSRTPVDPEKKRWHIIFTGIVIGLGSSPTHEVIRAIQEYKKNRKGVNIARPNQPGPKPA